MEEDDEIGQVFLRNNLASQVEACEEILREILNEILDEGDPEKVDEIQRVGQAEFEGLQRATRRVFDEPDKIRDVHLSLKRILRVIAKDLGFHEQLIKPDNTPKDNTEALFYWFRLHAKLVGEWDDVRYEYAVTRTKHDRDIEEHELPDRYNRPDLVGVATLVWYAFEDILRNWHQCRGKEISYDLNKSKYGFIHKIGTKSRDDVGFITAYSEGESGDDTYFEKDQIDFFPAIGDAVEFTDGPSSGHHDNYTADDGITRL